MWAQRSVAMVQKNVNEKTQMCFSAAIGENIFGLIKILSTVKKFFEPSVWFVLFCLVKFFHRPGVLVAQNAFERTRLWITQWIFGALLLPVLTLKNR